VVVVVVLDVVDLKSSGGWRSDFLARGAEAEAR